MIPIKELLKKIKWDKSQNPKEYTIYYYDRVKCTLLEIKYTDIQKIEDEFLILEKNNQEINIPLHRVKKIKKGNKVIWRRG